MSIWHEIKEQEDVGLSLDKKTLEVCYGSDRNGNLYVDIPIEFVKAALEDVAGQPDVIAMLPTSKEINIEADSYDNSMSSMAEATWMPQGFKEGVKWVIKKLKERPSN